MSNDMRRSFHGCMTCRSRKVRCPGGDPCQRCTRLRLACQSSFEQNLKISTSHKKPPTPKAHSSKRQRSAENECATLGLPWQTSRSSSSVRTSPPPLSRVQDISTSAENAVSDQYLWDPSYDLDPFASISTHLSPSHLSFETLFASSDQDFPWTDEQSQPPLLPDSVHHSQTDAFFFAHFEACIGKWSYSLRDDGKGNYLRFVLNTAQDARCNPQSPFRLAVLAWAAKHWAVTSDSESMAWRTYYDRATFAVARLVEHSDEPSHVHGKSPTSSLSSTVDLVISSMLFLCRCDILNHDHTAVAQRLANLRQWLDVHLASVSLSAFSSQLLLWLSYLDVKITIFSATCNGAGTTLLDMITRHPAHEDILTKSHSYLTEIFGDGYSIEDRVEDVEKVPIGIRTHETFCLLASVLAYSNLKTMAYGQRDVLKTNELIEARETIIKTDMRRLELEFVLAATTNPSAAIIRSTATTTPLQSPNSTFPAPFITTPPQPNDVQPLERISLQWLSCYSFFLGVKILWSRILNPTLRSESSAVNALTSIFHLLLQMRRASRISTASVPWSQKLPRSMQWPFPLFMAGIETTDEIHADWAREFLDEVAMAWAGDIAANEQGENKSEGLRRENAQRVQALMSRVHALQNETGQRIDVRSVVREFIWGHKSFLL